LIVVHSVHTWEVSPLEVSAGLKFIFSAHMNAMGLKLFVGTEMMCLFHEPTEFGPNIFLNIFSGPFKSHLCCIAAGSNRLH
jgi:hypothetical protein